MVVNLQQSAKMDDFYIHLSSDGSREYFPLNTISNFRNVIPGGIELGYDYQVALVDCSYLPSNVILSKGELVGTQQAWSRGICVYEEVYSTKDYTDVRDLIQDYGERGNLSYENDRVIQVKSYRLGINKFTYSDKLAQVFGLDTGEMKSQKSVDLFDHLVKFPNKVNKSLNAKISKYQILGGFQKTDPKYLFSEEAITASNNIENWEQLIATVVDQIGAHAYLVNDFLYLNFPNEDVQFVLIDELVPYFGMGVNTVVWNQKNPPEEDVKLKLGYTTYTCDRLMKNAGNSEMFIYSNIVKNQYINDIQAPILRKFPQEHDGKTRIYKTFTSHYYMDVAVPNLDYVHMYIMNENGRELPLRYEPFACTLHFRKKK